MPLLYGVSNEKIQRVPCPCGSGAFFIRRGCGEENFEDGSYTKVKGTYAHNTLTEYFSFFCGHCVRFQPMMHDLEKDFPEVKFSRVHVAFLGGDLGTKMQSSTPSPSRRALRTNSPTGCSRR